MKIVNVGRASSNDVVVNSPVVSSLHAVLYVHTDGTVDIKDCQSSNGTFVNDKRATGPVTLKPGDRGVRMRPRIAGASWMTGL